jgi:EmrB/QacA subfamily drug resistance transporter
MDTRTMQRGTLVATILGAGTVFLDSSIVSVALPAMQRELEMTLGQQQWIASSYLLLLSSFLMIGGRLSDLFGRRRMFSLGLLAYAALSLTVALAPSAGWVIGARAAQGLAGAGLVPCTLAIVSATFPRSERGKAIGTWSAWSGISTILGPVVGGVLIDNLSWRFAFVLSPMLALVALATALRYVPESRDEEASGRVDLLGAALAAVALGGPVYALIEAPNAGWTALRVLVPAIAGLLALAAFFWWERRAPEPMVPLEIFENRNLAVANVATLFIYAALGGAFFYVVLYVQSALGLSATVSGAVFIPVTLMLFFLSRYAGRLSDDYGPRWLMTLGPMGAAAGFVILAFVNAETLWVALAAGVVVFGLGIGFTVAPLTSTAVGSAEERYAGLASGVNNAVSRVAGLIAIAVLGLAISTAWQASLHDALASRDAGDPVAEAVLAVEDRAFVQADTAGLSAEAAEAATGITLEAARTAHAWGMGLAALLAALGGLASFLGVRNVHQQECGEPCVHHGTGAAGAPMGGAA